MSRTAGFLALCSVSAILALGLPCRVGFGEGLPELRTPKAPPTPRINGPKLYGSRPGHPFLYRIPCTGLRPMHFSVVGLPSSLTLDEATGIISGSAPATAGDYPMTLKAVNSRGTVTRSFEIVVGDQLGLTPQMGWNGWYTLYERPTDSDIRRAADAMVASGMAEYGYQFVDIDDGWARKPGSSDATFGGSITGLGRNHPAEWPIPKYDGPDRVHPLSRIESWYLFRPRTSDMCGSGGILWTRRLRCSPILEMGIRFTEI